MSLSIAYIQFDIHWEDKTRNLAYLSALIERKFQDESLIVLPEMFSTGFSMEPQRLSETIDGQTVKWMMGIGKKYDTCISGSIIIEEDGKYFNRFLFVDKNGVIDQYDKRHLFNYAGEGDQYTSGKNTIVFHTQSWKIMPLICYDLRFPAWSRNTEDGYDLLIYVASWPETRIQHWKTLLAARAIENQCYCLGVNRIGEDGNNLKYNGYSGLYDFNGNLISNAGEESGYYNVTMQSDHLPFRSKLNFLPDRDSYQIS